MFCPNCGLEDKQSNQFCRACGADLRSVRNVIARPDDITESAASARDEIGRAVAAKIREMDSARDLTEIAEDVLPQIEKFLESPAEKRLRRIRTGTIISSVGLGATLAFKVMAILLLNESIFFLAGLGMITFFIGLSFVLNGLFFSVPKKGVSNNSPDAQSQRELDVAEAETNELVLPESNNVFSSVTEPTTQLLKEKQPLPRG